LPWKKTGTCRSRLIIHENQLAKNSVLIISGTIVPGILTCFKTSDAINVF